MKNKRVFYTVFSIIFLIVAYSITSAIIDMPMIVPYPKDVFTCIKDLFFTAAFRQSVLLTFYRCLFSFLISFFLGIILGLLCAWNKAFDYFFIPILKIIQSVPVVSIILIVLFWLKSDYVPVLSAVLMACPIVINSIKKGISSCNKQDLKVADYFGFTALQKFLFIRFEGCRPYIKTAVDNTAALIWKVVAAGEVLTLPKRALGSYLSRAQITLESQELIAVTVVIVLLCFFSSILLKVLGLFLRFIFEKLTFYYFMKKDSINSSDVEEFNQNTDICVKSFNFINIYKDFDVTFESKTTSVIFGESGCGKTSLLNHIADQYKSVSYMTQKGFLVENLTVLQNVMLPLINIYGRKKAYEKACQIISSVGLSNNINQKCKTLSGGQRQRVSLAQCFAYPSDILLLDEAFNSQDICTKLKLIDLFKVLNSQQKRTVIIVDHDITEAVNLGDRVIVLKGKPVKVIYDQKPDFISTDKIKSLLLS